MAKTPMPEDQAIAELLRLLKWNPRISAACAREKTSMCGDAVRALVAKRPDLFGIVTIRGYEWVTTAAERAATTGRR